MLVLSWYHEVVEAVWTSLQGDHKLPSVWMHFNLNAYIGIDREQKYRAHSQVLPKLGSSVCVIVYIYHGR